MMTTRRPRRPRRQRQGGAPAAPEGRAPLRSRRSGRSVLPRCARPSSRPASPRRRRSSDAWRPGCRGGCGRAGHRRSSSRVVMAARASGNGGDGARSVEIVDDITAKAPAGADRRCAEKSNPTNHMRPTEGRRFYLAVRWSGSWAPTFQRSNVRHGPPAYDQARPASWLPISMRHADEQALRLRRQTRPILRWTVGRSLARTRIG